MSKSLSKKPTAEEGRLEELNKLNYLQARLAYNQALKGQQANDRVEKIAKGELKVKDNIVLKNGEVVEVEKSPNHRVILDANVKMVEWARGPETQRHEHTGFIGFGIQNLTDLQLNKIILDALQKQEVLTVDAEIVGDSEDNPGTD